MKVHTTFWPDREIEVGDAEYIDLARQGLLIESPAPVAHSEPVEPPAVQETQPDSSAVAVRPSADNDKE